MRSLTLAIILLGTIIGPLTAHAEPRFRTPVNTYAWNPTFYQYYDNDVSSSIRSWQCGSKTYDHHQGTDIATGYGTPLYAGANGIVYYREDTCPNTGYWQSKCGNGFGNHVRIAHTYPYNSTASWVTIYGHMAQGINYVGGIGYTGCGWWIGNAASSGSSTAPHVHFQVNHYGYPHDDPFAGSCSGPVSYWVNQNGGLPTTQCQ